MLDVERLEELRKSKGWTMEQAAERAGLTGRSYWSDMVAGRKANITMDVLDRLASAFGISAKDLLRDNE